MKKLTKIQKAGFVMMTVGIVGQYVIARKALKEANKEASSAIKYKADGVYLGHIGDLAILIAAKYGTANTKILEEKGARPDEIEILKHWHLTREMFLKGDE